MVKPGIKMNSIYQAIHQTVHENGIDWFARGHTGHMVGIGIGPGHIEQPPFISAGENLELEPNMVLTLEIGTYINGIAAIQIEDEILVTPAGCEVLTNLPRDLIEL